MRALGRASLLLVTLLGAGLAQADGRPDVLNMRFGTTGLLQTPTARLAGDGELRVGVGNSHPYRNFFITAEPLPRLQATFRFISVQNREYEASPNGQSLKDKSFDAKLLLLRESSWLPEISVGAVDFGGTGLFSSEYLVASRRIFNFDVSAGVAWGRLGARGGIRNPLSSLSDRFEERPRADPGGGQPNTEAYFSGREIGVFGGVQWSPGGGPWTLIAEYDGNDYRADVGRNIEVDTPINIGVNYRMADFLDLGLSFERGNTLSFGIGFRTNFNREFGPPKVLDPAPLPIPATAPTAEGVDSPQPVAPSDDTRAPSNDEIGAALATEMAAVKIKLKAVSLDEDQGLARVWFSQSTSTNMAQAAGRAARAVTRVVPPTIHSIEVVELIGDLEIYRVTFPRETLHNATAGLITPDELRDAVHIEGRRSVGQGEADFVAPGQFPAFSYALAPGLRYNIGRPDGFVIGAITAMAHATVDLTPRLSVSGAYGYSLFDNVNKIEVDFPSALPRVRSNSSRYLRTGKDYIATLESNYIWPISSTLTGRISAGYLDEMFGGVGGEILYSPPASRLSVGVSLARVRQRDFDQKFDFIDYEATTGHLSFYYEAPWQNILAQVSVGQYLAEDRGVTFDMSRRFANGARVGAWATFTNVSSEDFGEGSFDKGFYIYMPFDLFLPRSMRGGTTFSFRPLTRDGGQKVRDGKPLYFMYDRSQKNRLYNAPQGYLQ